MNYHPITEEQVINRIEAVYDGWIEKLKGLEEHKKNLKDESDNVIRKLNDKEKHLVRLYQELLFLRTERADTICKASMLTYPLFSWIADKLGYSRQELVRFSKNEIIEMINSRKRIDSAKRKEYHAIFVNGKFKVYWGSFGERKEDEIVIKEIKGTIACKGIARGIVKIINETHDLNKFEKGNILVAPYTNPNLVPAMEKAAAIVTNIGGMTSHAAIISRELNKPCIIGTENATKVLKDGYLVEVDANKGIVKVIKRK
jgi:phosphohistidine swiveling domain-containing protein/uncharacterized protein (UPF0335 family)